MTSMLTALALAFALQSTAVDASAILQSAPALKPAKPAKGSPDEVICRYEEETGSMMGKRKCRTRADWEGLAQAGAASLDRYRSDVRTGGPR